MEIASQLMLAFHEVLCERKFNWPKCTSCSQRGVIKVRKEKGLGFHLFLASVRCTGSMVLRKHKRLVEHCITHTAVKEKTPKEKKAKQNIGSTTALKILIKINLSRPLKPFWLQLVCFSMSNTHSCTNPVPMIVSRNVTPCLNSSEQEFKNQARDLKKTDKNWALSSGFQRVFQLRW